MPASQMAGAHQIARLISAGHLSAREVVSACIARIETTNRSINALVVPRFDEALAEADLADGRRRRGEALGALHGVPITVKESFDLAGTPSTLGLTTRTTHRAEHDGPLVSHLRRAGAIVIGKTNVSQLLVGGPCSNPVYGQTNNPWRLDRSSGASSGGEAAIVAVGGSSLGLGSDLGGSLRLPADACGVHSLKPTSGRLTMRGHAPLYPGQEAIACQPGPLARSVADLALALRVMIDADRATLDPSVMPVAGVDHESVPLAGLRVAFYTANGLITPSPAIRRAVSDAAHALLNRGVLVEEWRPPHLTELWRVYCGLLFADGFASLRRAARNSQLTPTVRYLTLLGLVPKSAFAVGSFILQLLRQYDLADAARSYGRLTVDEYWRLVDRRANLRDSFLAALGAGRFDAILCPTFATPAPPHRQSIFLNEALSYTAVYNVLGLPAGVVAATRVRADEETDRNTRFNAIESAVRAAERGSVGLPVGVQVVARHWREDVVLKIMGALENHFRQQSDYPEGPPL